MPLRSALGFFFAGLLAGSAHASFHFMQIEQVIGGVSGDTSAQAIQLRMRLSGQNLVHQARIRAWDAAGANPVLIIDMTTDVPVGNMGSRVLIASSSFPAHTTPTAVPNFTMTNTIPPSYLAAGSLTFESDGGTIYWRLSWGGSAYTGSNLGDVTNDPNGNFGPPWPNALPSTGTQALHFTGSASAASNNNAADYALTSGAAVFTNNAGASFTVQPIATGACCIAGVCSTLTSGQCTSQGGAYQGDGSDCGSIVCDACGTVVAGDSNCDGILDNSDIDCFVAALVGGQAGWEACVQAGQPGCTATYVCSNDVNGDGVVDNSDIDPFVSCLLGGPCP